MHTHNIVFSSSVSIRSFGQLFVIALLFMDGKFPSLQLITGFWNLAFALDSGAVCGDPFVNVSPRCCCA